jgi:UPF0176 protein
VLQTQCYNFFFKFNFKAFKRNLEQYRDKKVAMFCTGGIRCEKSTAYLKSQGFKTVYHLSGGVLKYLEEVDEADSLWEGECFVFDERVAVKHNLEQGQYGQCHACRYPITKEDKQHQHYEKGVSCPRCYGTRSDEQPPVQNIATFLSRYCSKFFLV